MKKNYLLLNFIVLLFSMTFGGYALQPTAADVYTPTVTDDEVSVFLETSSSHANIWAWNDKFLQLTSAKYPGDALKLMGKAPSGNNIFKWTFNDASTKGMPTMILFNRGDGDENKIGGDITFKNHGYYVDGICTKIISSVSQKTFTLLNNGATVDSNTTGSFVMDLTNETADAVVSFKIGDSAYGLDDNKEISVTGETNYTATEGATGKLTLKAGLIYTISITADGAVKVVAAKMQVYTRIAAPAGYYLVGNFMSPANVGGDINPGGDDVDKINYDRLYFRFTQLSDNKYSFDIPACLTANMQILNVVDNGDMTAYGPGKVYDINGTWPKTDLTVPEAGSTASLTPSATLDKGNNYWRLKTRNDGTYDDDGMYTVNFELDENGTPTNWSIKHNSLKMVSYLLSTAYGATAVPIYDTRTMINSLYTQNIKADIHFNGKNSYYVLGYSVYTMDDNVIKDLANKAYKESGTADNIHVNNKIGNNYGTQNKLFFFGNGGYKFETANDHDKVYVNQKPFTLNISGTKQVEYNPNRGNNNLAKETNACGMSASFQIPNPDQVDYPDVISLVGSAIPGTTNPDGSWNWASTAANMTFDANENCYYATIETTVGCHDKYFRFVGDHSQAKNWYEDDINTEAHMARCEHNNPTGHTCLVDDPNTVSYTFNGETEKTELENGIIWNREAGLYTVKLYIVTNPETKNTEFKYTITGEKNVKYPFTLFHDKFVRTYSSHQAMDIVSPDVRAYVAWKYEKPGQDEITKEYSCGKIYLRKIDYIPADMGVVLVGATPGEGFSEGDMLNYSLRKRTDPSVEPENYVKLWSIDHTGDEWNNYLVPAVEGKTIGNSKVENGETTYRYFGLSSFYNTKYHKQNPNSGLSNYLGFFRFMSNGRVSSNKAYLSLPANATVGNRVGETYGYCDYDGQFIGGSTDDNTSFAKVMMLFDDEMGDVTEINKIEVTTKRNDNAYYTLQGIKVLKPTKGIYIHNGKKIVIK